MVIIPFSVLLPAGTFPLGQNGERSLAYCCSVGVTARSCVAPSSIGHPCGRRMSGSVSAGPAWLACTVKPPSSSRQMIILPAAPVPTTV
jgi:hypothetical protein